MDTPANQRPMFSSRGLSTSTATMQWAALLTKPNGDGSTLCHALENNTLNIPPPRCLPGSEVKTLFVILPDDAFALKPFMMKPFNFRGQDRNELIFNYRLSRARRMVESTFGIMADRFRLLRTTIELNKN